MVFAHMLCKGGATSLLIRQQGVTAQNLVLISMLCQGKEQCKERQAAIRKTAAGKK